MRIAHYFSPKTCGFYRSDIHDSVPDDAVKITAAHQAKMMMAQSKSAQIVPSANGRPVAKLTVITRGKQRDNMLAAIKFEAERRVSAAIMSALGIADILASIDALRAAAKLIAADVADSHDPIAVPIADHPLWPDFKVNSKDFFA
jgi:hypothetical protein